MNGTAVTLASNSEVAGFAIVGSTGNGISGSGVSGVSLHDLMFTSIGGDAINLANSTGNVTMSNIQVNSATGNGIVFNGGNANISYFGSGSTITAQGNGFVLENLTGGTVGIKGLSLSNIGGTGLVIDNAATNINVDSLTVSTSGTNPAGNPTPGSAVAISGLTGTNQVVNGASTKVYNTYNFTGNTKISSPGGAGFAVSGSDANINVANLNVTSTSALPAISLVNSINPITFGSVVVNTQNATGLFADTVTNLQINNGSITSVNAPAVDIASSGIHANFGSVSANGGPFGIRLLGSTGGFMVHGNGAFGTGGTIQNTTTAGVLINSAVSTSLDLDEFHEQRRGDSVDRFDTAGTVQLEHHGFDRICGRLAERQERFPGQFKPVVQWSRRRGNGTNPVEYCRFVCVRHSKQQHHRFERHGNSIPDTGRWYRCDTQYAGRVEYDCRFPCRLADHRGELER